MLLKDTIYINPDMKKKLQQIKLDLNLKNLDEVIEDMYKVYKENKNNGS